MDLITIRHASAEPRGKVPEFDRQLTDAGQREAQAAGRALRELGVNLELIITSPLVRAVQTAEIVAALHDAPVETANFLSLDFDQAALRKRARKLAAEGCKAVALVGHAPSLDESLREMIGAGAEMNLSLPKGGAALLKVEDDSGPAELRWLMRRKQLALLAKA